VALTTNLVDVLGERALTEQITCDVCEVTVAHYHIEDFDWCEQCDWLVQDYGINQVVAAAHAAPGRRNYIIEFLETWNTPTEWE
jgi:hypothetical protein